MSDQTKNKDSSQDQQPGTEISRRNLLKAGGAATVAAGSLLAGSAAAAAGGSDAPATDWDGVRKMGNARESYWKEDGKYFVQDNVDASKVDEGIIRARVDGQWRSYVIRELDDEFFDFNVGMRNRMLEVMTGSKSYSLYNDGHNAAVGSYGGNRGDSRFSLNVAFKGMGWVPVPSKIEERTKKLADNYTNTRMEKMKILATGYADKSMWERRLQISLELYTRINNETHTFLNQMINPVASICFCGEWYDTKVMPPKYHNLSYELRAIARLIHPNDPGLTDYEKKVVKYINFAHDFFHGGPDPYKLIVHNIGVIYWLVEEFDNSPFGQSKTSGGQKRVPAP
jgi:hypothetical protein